MAEFASKGVAGTGLGLGIAGTALGLINGGGLGNIFGGSNSNGNGCCDSDSQFVTRYEERIVSENALLKANIFTDQKSVELFKELNTQINSVKDYVIAIDKAQAVTNQAMADNLRFVDAKIDSTAKELYCYVNATFVPGKLNMPLDSICPQAMPKCDVCG